MTEININSVQNRFTAYLVAVVMNQRIRYIFNLAGVLVELQVDVDYG